MIANLRLIKGGGGTKKLKRYVMDLIVQVSDRIDSHMINNQEIKFTKRKA
jgi:hypothetical protein